MQITKVNTNFSGKLYLNNPKLWTADMKAVIQNNDSITRKLRHYDIIGNITTKIEKDFPPYGSRHTKGDTLYKVSFSVTEENKGFLSRIKNKLFGTLKTYDINRHYHSERTIIERLSNFKF